MTPKSSKHINIDRLLDKTFAYGVDWTEYREKQLTGDNDVATYAAKIKDEFKDLLEQQLYDLMLEIIGEDDTNWQGIGEHDLVRYQNDLRQEQRQKLTDLFKGDKE